MANHDAKYSWLRCTAADGTTDQLKRLDLPPVTQLALNVFPENFDASVERLDLQVQWHLAVDATFAITLDDELHVSGLDGATRLVCPLRSMLGADEADDAGVLAKTGALVVPGVPHVVAQDCTVAIVAGLRPGSTRPPGRRLIACPFTTIDPEYVADRAALAKGLDVAATHRGVLAPGVRVEVVVRLNVTRMIAEACDTSLPEERAIRMAQDAGFVALVPRTSVVSTSGSLALAPGNARDGLQHPRCLLPLKNCVVSDSRDAVSGDRLVRWECAFAAIDDGEPMLQPRLYVQHAPGRPEHQHVPFPIAIGDAVAYNAEAPDWDEATLGLSPLVEGDLRKSSLMMAAGSCDVDDAVDVVIDLHPRDFPWGTVPTVEADAVPASRLSPIDKLVLYPYGRSDHLNTLILEPSEAVADCVGVQALRARISVRAPATPGRYEAALLAFFPRQVCALSTTALTVRCPFISMAIERVAVPLSIDDAASKCRLVATISGPARIIHPGADRIVVVNTKGKVLADAAMPPVTAVGGDGAMVESVQHGDGAGAGRYTISSESGTPAGGVADAVELVDPHVQARLMLTGIERYPLRGAAFLEYRSRHLRTAIRTVPVHLDDEDVQLPVDMATPPAHSFWHRLPALPLRTRAIHPRGVPLAVRVGVVAAPGVDSTELARMVDGALIAVALASSSADCSTHPPDLPVAGKWRFDQDDPATLPPAVSPAHVCVLSSNALLDRDNGELRLEFPNRLPDGDYTVAAYVPVSAAGTVDRALIQLNPSAVPVASYRLVSFAVTRVSQSLPKVTFVPLPAGKLPADDGEAPTAPWHSTVDPAGAVATGSRDVPRIEATSPEVTLIADKQQVQDAPKSRALAARPASAYRTAEQGNMPPASALVPYKRPDAVTTKIAIICNNQLTTADSVVATLHCLKGYTPDPADRMMLVDDLWSNAIDSVALVDGTSRQGNFSLSTVALRSVPVPGVYYVLLYSDVLGAAIAFSAGIKIVPADQSVSTVALANEAASHGAPEKLLLTDTQTAPGHVLRPGHGEAPAGAAKMRALLIGCSQIGTAAELHGCENDVSRLSRSLAAAWPRHNCDVKIDKIIETGDAERRPTSHTVRTAIARFVDSVDAGSHAVLYYSGLGAVRRSRSKEHQHAPEACLVPTGASLGSGLISETELAGAVQQLRGRAGPSGSVTVILDCGFETTVMDAAKHWNLWRDSDAVQESGITQHLTEATTEEQRRLLAARAARESDSRLPAGVSVVWSRRDRVGIERRAATRCLALAPHFASRASVGDVPSAAVEGLFAAAAPFSASNRGVTPTVPSGHEHADAVAPLTVYQAGRRVAWETFAPGGTGGVFTSALCSALDDVCKEREARVRGGPRPPSKLPGLAHPSLAMLHEAVCRKLFFGPFRSQKPLLRTSSAVQLAEPCGLLSASTV